MISLTIYFPYQGKCSLRRKKIFYRLHFVFLRHFILTNTTSDVVEYNFKTIQIIILGYLRDLSLDDYVKWEEWWYKYQDWLQNERHYEHWLATHNNSGGGRRRKKRVPASQRLGT